MRFNVETVTVADLLERTSLWDSVQCTLEKSHDAEIVRDMVDKMDTAALLETPIGVYITGGAGFIGSRIARTILAFMPNAHVVLVDNLCRSNAWPPSIIQSDRVHYVWCDVRGDSELIEIEEQVRIGKLPNIDMVIHAAGLPYASGGSVGSNVSVDLMEDVHIMGAANVARWYRRVQYERSMSHEACDKDSTLRNLFVNLSTSRIYPIETLYCSGTLAVPIKTLTRTFLRGMPVTSTTTALGAATRPFVHEVERLAASTLGLHVSIDDNRLEEMFLSLSMPCKQQLAVSLMQVRYGLTEIATMHNGPRSFYGATKYAAENLVSEYMTHTGLPHYNLRFGMVAGPTQQGVRGNGIVNFWIKHWLDGKEPLYYLNGYEGYQMRDVMSDVDASMFILQLMLARLGGIVYAPTINVSGGIESQFMLRDLSLFCLERFRGVEQRKVDSLDNGPAFDAPWCILSNKIAEGLALPNPCGEIQSWHRRHSDAQDVFRYVADGIHALQSEEASQLEQ